MHEIDIEQAARAVDGGGAFIDVREPGEFREGHIPGAVNVPMSRLASRLDDLDRTRRVHVVCASGGRSSAMTDVLTAAGFDAVNVAGGTSAWIRAGRPIEK